MPATTRRRDTARTGFGWCVAALSILAAALVSYGIGHDNLWLDEGASVHGARASTWLGLLTVEHGNMPLYLALLKAWLSVGDSEEWVRFLSAVPFVATVPAVAVLGRRLFSPPVGLLAAAIVATSPALVRYGQEARGFALVTLLVTGGTLALVVGVQEHRRTFFVSGVVLLALATYVHPIAGFAGVAILLWTSARLPAALPVPVGTTVALYGFSVAPLVFVVLTSGSQQIDWIGHGDQTALRTLVSMVYDNTADNIGALVVAPFAALGCVAAFRATVRDPANLGKTLAALPAVVVLGTVLPVLIVSIYRSLLVPRYVLFVVPAVALCAADGAMRIPWKRAGVMALVVVACSTALTVVLRHGETRDSDWYDVQQFVAAHAEPGDATLFVPASNASPFEYYELAGAGGAPSPVLPMGRWGDLPPDLFGVDEARDIDRGLDAVQQHDRVWVLSGGFVRQADAQHVEDGLQRLGPPALDRRFGDVRARLFLNGST